MKIKVKLFATLADYLPTGTRDNQMDVDVAEKDDVAAVIERLGLPQKLVHLVLVNGAYVAPAERRGRHLAEGDHLAVWPPVAGG